MPRAFYAAGMNQHFASAQEAARRGPLFIVMNAGSGRHDADETRQIIAGVLDAAGREHEFLLVKQAAEIQDIAQAAVARARERGGVVLAACCDGTISAVAHAVLGSGCPFGVLPQGTFNYFGRAHAIPQDAETATRALLAAGIELVQVGQVNGQVFLVNASVGLYPKLLEDREAFKRQFGRSRLVAFVAGLATLLQWRGQLRLQTETAAETATGTPAKTAMLRTPTLFVGNNHLQLDRVGIEQEDADAVELGYLAAIVVRPIGTLALLGLLLRGLLGRLGDAEHIRSFTFRHLTVSPRGMRRIKVATDGEVQWMRTPLVFEVATEPLLLLVPALADQAEVA